jgi:hypothetical protein
MRFQIFVSEIFIAYVEVSLGNSPHEASEHIIIGISTKWAGSHHTYWQEHCVVER